jgi:hypothetical protein
MVSTHLASQMALLDSLHPRSPFDATAYVETLEEVDISTIAPEDMNCPHCWYPFGTIGEVDNPSVLAYLSEEEHEETARQTAMYEIPF